MFFLKEIILFLIQLLKFVFTPPQKKHKRYYVIVTGQESLFLTKSSHTKLVIAFIWFMASFIASPILLATKISPVIYLNETYVECIEDWSFIDTDNSHSIGTIYTIIVFIMTFILPVVALTYLYGHIGLIVYKHSFPIDDDNRVTNQNLTQTKVKVLKMLLLLVISFIICWSPCQIFYLMLWIFEDIRQDPGNNVLVDNDPGNDPSGDNLADNNVEATNVTSYYSIIYYSIYFISHWLACSHTIMNPFIYCFCSNNFRISDISSILCCTTNRQDSWINRSTYSNNNNNNNNNNTNNNVNIGTNDNTNNGHDNNNHIDEIRKNPKKLFRFKSSKTTTAAAAATMIQKNDLSTTTPTMTKDLFNNNDSLKQHQHRQSKSKWLIQNDRNMHSIAALTLSSSSSSSSTSSSSSSSTIPSTSIIANRLKINDKLNKSMLKIESNKDHNQDKHQNNQIYLKNNLIAYANV